MLLKSKMKALKQTVLLGILLSISGIRAEEFGGIEFPAGEISFADEVVLFDPLFGGGPQATRNTNPAWALGVPNFPSQLDNDDVSLGQGGRLTLRFTDNLLTGSGNADPDLHIFEVGPDVEDTFVEVSRDGVTWFEVGKVGGGISSIDIDAFGYDQNDLFQYVRLTDDPNEGGRTGETVGADIDAVGAISSRENFVPRVLSHSINFGAAQRSMIQSIGLEFSQDVSSVVETQDLNLWNIDLQEFATLGGIQLVNDPRSNTVSWVLPENSNALLPDGNYLAWFEVDQTASDSSVAMCSVNSIPLDDYTFTFHQFAGDSDGDRDVDFLDTCVVRESWMVQKGNERYQSFFDFDLSGMVEEQDRLVIQPNHFSILPKQVDLHPYLRNDTGDSVSDLRSSSYAVGLGVSSRELIDRLEFRINGGVYFDATTKLNGSGRAFLSEEEVDATIGAPLAIGPHRVDFRALDGEGIVLSERSIEFEYLGEVNCDPYFISSPDGVVVLPTGDSAGPNDRVFRVPGLPGNSVSATFDWTIRSASFNNEFGIYRIEDPDGRVDGVLPGEAGYSVVALSEENSTVIFLSGEGVGASKEVELVSGDLYGFYIIQNSNSDTFRANNAGNLLGGRPLAFLSFAEANPDGIDHLISSFLDDGRTQFAWEDLTGVGDQTNPINFRDVVFTIDLLFSQVGEGVFVYQAEAIDPEGEPITYHLVSNPDGSETPEGAVIDENLGNLQWQPDTQGLFQFTIEARDSSGGAGRQSFFVQVQPTDLPPAGAISKQPSNPGPEEEVVIQVFPQDDVAIRSVDLTVDGQMVELDSRFSFTTSYPDFGPRYLEATITDSAGQVTVVSDVLTVIDPSNPPGPGTPDSGVPGLVIGSGDGPEPFAQILSPVGPGDDLSLFTGTVNGGQGTLQEWTLDYTLQSSVNPDDFTDPSVSWTLIASDTNARDREVLGELDLSTLENEVYLFRLIARNTNGSGVLRGFYANPLDNTAPSLAITSPEAGSEITFLTEVRGSVDADGGTIRNWSLDYLPAEEVSLGQLNDNSLAWRAIASGTESKDDEVLGIFDPTLLKNGSIVIRLRAFNTNGRGTVTGALYGIGGQAKLGNFRVESTDLSLPLQGIPIQVRRIYDTLDAERSRDFGFGWTMGICDSDIRETVPASGGIFGTGAPFFVGTRVYINTPDGRRVGYTMKLRNPRSSLFFTTWEPYLEPDPGVYEELLFGESELSRVSQSSDGSIGAPLFSVLAGFNPDTYRLRLQDGTVYFYGQRSGLTKIEDSNGNIVTVTANGFQHSSGASIDFVRDARGRITQINAPNNRTISYVYDAAGDLVGVTNEVGAETTFTYLNDPAHYLETIANPEDAAQGRFTQRVIYDAGGRVTQVEDGDGNVFAQQSFDPGSFTGTRTDARGNVTNLTYDERGNLLREELPEGGVTQYEYTDPANPDRETAIIDPRGNRMEMTYDSRGNKLTETDPLGNVSEFTYNSLSKITSLVRRDSVGNVLTSESAEYDSEGNLTKLINCAGDERSFAYDLDGRLVMSTDFEGNLTEYDYTNACPCGSPSAINYADGTTKTFRYNAFGQVIETVDETGAITRFEYDSLGRQTAEIDHDGNRTRFDYDSNNNLIQRTDRLGRVSKFEYDSRNRLAREIKILTDDGDDSNDTIITYEYDGDDRLTALIDPVGNRTEFVYDGDGRLEIRRDAAGAETFVAYDLAGNTASIIDRNGRKRSFLYDERNLPTAERWHASDDSIIRTISSAYDNLGRRTSISDPDSAYAYTYDVCSRVQTISNAGTPNMPAVTLTHAYNKDGLLTSVMDSDGVSVTTGYDNRNRSTSFVWQGGGISPASVDINRNGRGQMTAINRHANAGLSNLVSQTTFDDIAPQGWIKQIQHKDATGALYNSGTNFTYSYDSEGQVIGQSSQGNSTTYTYDLTGQLTGANHTNEAIYPDEFYQYDQSGNRTASHLHASYTTGVANRLQSDGVHNYSYNDGGDLIMKTEIATGATQSFTYDHRGRVTSIIERDGSSVVTKTLTFVHDALDRLIGRSEDGATFYTLYHVDNAWVDYEQSGGVIARYLFADRIDANLAKWTSSDATEWFLPDLLGSVRGMVSAAGAVTDSMGYDSFGRSQFGSQSFIGQRYGFTGREAIGGGVINYRSRKYSTQIGSFLQEDKIGLKSGDSNFYRYIVNNPLSGVDPTGKIGLSYSRFSALAIRAYQALQPVAVRIIGNIVCPAVTLASRTTPRGASVIITQFLRAVESVVDVSIPANRMAIEQTITALNNFCGAVGRGRSGPKAQPPKKPLFPPDDIQ